MKISVIATENGKLGPLNGPFTFALDQGIGDIEAIEVLIGYVTQVVQGVSVYNKNDMEASSNLNSFAIECFEDLKSEWPEAAEKIENLTLDCSPLPASVKDHPIWKLDRAIMKNLPGILLVD